MKINKLTIFKMMFLMILSLKVSYAVFQNISVISDSAETAIVLDIDESEKEEGQETDETEKIHEKVKAVSLNPSKDKSKFNSKVVFNYKLLHLEFTTPPPEII